jgi:hypothetical protein
MYSTIAAIRQNVMNTAVALQKKRTEEKTSRASDSQRQSQNKERLGNSRNVMGTAIPRVAPTEKGMKPFT